MRIAAVGCLSLVTFIPKQISHLSCVPYPPSWNTTIQWGSPTFSHSLPLQSLLAGKEVLWAGMVRHCDFSQSSLWHYLLAIKWAPELLSCWWPTVASGAGHSSSAILCHGVADVEKYLWSLSSPAQSRNRLSCWVLNPQQWRLHQLWVAYSHNLTVLTEKEIIFVFKGNTLYFNLCPLFLVLI